MRHNRLWAILLGVGIFASALPMGNDSALSTGATLANSAPLTYELGPTKTAQDPAPVTAWGVQYSWSLSGHEYGLMSYTASEWKWEQSTLYVNLLGGLDLDNNMLVTGGGVAYRWDMDVFYASAGFSMITPTDQKNSTLDLAFDVGFGIKLRF